MWVAGRKRDTRVCRQRVQLVLPLSWASRLCVYRALLIAKSRIPSGLLKAFSSWFSCASVRLVAPTAIGSQARGISRVVSRVQGGARMWRVGRRWGAAPVVK